MIEIAPSGLATTTSLPISIFLVEIFFAAVLGSGRWLGPRAYHSAKSHVSWPTAFIALTILIILVAGSISEGLGIHAFLGAFLVGVVLGGKDEVNKEDNNL